MLCYRYVDNLAIVKAATNTRLHAEWYYYHGICEHQY